MFIREVILVACEGKKLINQYFDLSFSIFQALVVEFVSYCRRFRGSAPDPFGLAKFEYGLHGVHNDYLSKGLHGGYGKKVELKFYADEEQNIQCKCVFSKDEVSNRSGAVKEAKKEALKSFENPREVTKALRKLEGGKEWYEKAGELDEWEN